MRARSHGPAEPHTRGALSKDAPELHTRSRAPEDSRSHASKEISESHSRGPTHAMDLQPDRQGPDIIRQFVSTLTNSWAIVRIWTKTPILSGT